MSKKERDSAARRKRAADPNQPQKSGAAKPQTFLQILRENVRKYFSEKKMVKVKLNPEKKIGVKVTDIGPGGKEVVKKIR